MLTEDYRIQEQEEGKDLARDGSVGLANRIWSVKSMRCERLTIQELFSKGGRLYVF